MAHGQTAGRGRRGRSWWSEPGLGLYASIVLLPEPPPYSPTALTIATALGVSTDDVAAGMARLLPLVVDRLTPDGTYPDDERLDSTDLSDIDLVALLGPG